MQARVETLYSDLFIESPIVSKLKKRKSLHEYELEPIRWSSGKTGEWVMIKNSSYPNCCNEENLCDKCGGYSDYFVSVFSHGRDGYHLTADCDRLCNTCIMKAWFEIIFKKRVPNFH